MVNVLGKDKSAYKYITCRNCASLLEYTQSEVVRVDGKDYTGGPDGKEYIECPSCGEEVIIKAW